MTLPIAFVISMKYVWMIFLGQMAFVYKDSENLG